MSSLPEKILQAYSGTRSGGTLPYVLGKVGSDFFVYRVFIAASDVSKTTQRVQEIQEQTRIAILAETASKVDALREAIVKHGLNAVAELGPSVDTIAACLKARRREA
jgi:hypothetical protein